MGNAGPIFYCRNILFIKAMARRVNMAGMHSGFFAQIPAWFIFKSDFLLQEDKMFLGNKMKKTLNGPQYLGGASDHLPILLKVFSPQL
jgi:hypothetical protein